MPTILRAGQFRFFFYSNEGSEPPHVHVHSGGRIAKFWLVAVELAKPGGFGSRDLRRIERLVSLYRETLLEAWHGYFGT